jgi:hypothetical protein
MKTIVLLKTHKGHATGQEVEVSNNEAHALIESGVARLKEFKAPRNKMVTKESRGSRIVRTRQFGQH